MVSIAASIAGTIQAADTSIHGWKWRGRFTRVGYDSAFPPRNLHTLRRPFASQARPFAHTMLKACRGRPCGDSPGGGFFPLRCSYMFHTCSVASALILWCDDARLAPQ